MKYYSSFLICILFVFCSSSEDDSSYIEEQPQPQVQRFDLTVNASNGGTVSNQGGNYVQGTVLSLTAIPDSEYLFNGWSNGSTENPLNITVESNLSITAYFVKRQYELLLNIDGQGTVSETIISSGKTPNEYDSGTIVRLTANPSNGWLFSNWSGSVSSTVNPVELTLDEAKNVTATFEREVVNLNLTIEGQGQLRIEHNNEIEVFTQSTLLSFATNSSLNLTAISNENSQFDGWLGTINDTLQLFRNKTLIVNQNNDLTLRFIPKNNGNKNIQNDYFDESVLDFRTSENFIVWWDKNWDHNHDAKDILKWAEFTRNKGISYGMEVPPGSEQVYINIYIHHKGNEGNNNIDVFNDGWGNGVGTDSNGLPFWTCPKPETRTDVEPFLTNSTLHEVFHIMQHKSGNTYGTFPYSGHTSWYTEATASWFEKTFMPYSISNENWYNYFNDFPSLKMNPHQSLWSSGIYLTEGGNPWNKTVQMYSLAQFFMYLNRINAISEGFIGASYYSQTTLTPQEYLYQNIPNLKEHFKNFAMKMYSLDWYSNSEKAGFLRMEELFEPGGFLNSYTKDLNNNNSIYPYVVKLNNTGSNGEISPSAKPQAWSWTTIEISNSTQSSYTIEFDGDLTGNEGTASDFYVGIVKQSVNGYNYSNINLVNGEGTKTVILDDSSVNYVVIVNTPNKFDGLEEFDYDINVIKN